MTDGVTDTKVKKVSCKFDIIFVLVFFAISIAAAFHVRYLEYRGGLTNQPWLFNFPTICYTLLLSVLFLFCVVRLFIRIFLPPRTIKHTLIKIIFACVPVIILFGSQFIFEPLDFVFLRGFEKWIKKEVDIKGIQQWLEVEGNRHKEKSYSFEAMPKDFQAFFKSSKPNAILFENSEVDGSLCIDLFYGGGMESWGVRISAPTMKTPKAGMITHSSYSEFRRPIAPGVYVYAGG